MAAFPDIAALAQAPEDQVMHHWTGLGYYARARNLHEAAKIIIREYAGDMPDTVETLSTLPGIGKSTAGAIVSLGFGKHASILDGNVKRVLSRHLGIEGLPAQTEVLNRLWELTESLTPEQGCATYNQAIMDLGATLCTRSKPACPLCPVREDCFAYTNNRVDEFPSRKPKKPLPVKATYMLIFHDREENRVLLEKRPPQGIWGGLWSFPEAEDINHLDRVLKNQVMTVAGAQHHWQPIRHTFSHYHLDITPVTIEVGRPHISIMENDRLHWYDLNQPPALGLAAPVKKLLGAIVSGT